MIKLSEKNRKILRTVYKGLGVTAVSLVFGACPFYEEPGSGWAAYGMPPDYVREELCIRGLVRTKDDARKPIRGIAVVIDGVNNNYPYITNDFGDFYIWMPKQESYKVIFTDIDGDKNGGRFKQYEITFTAEEIIALDNEPILIDLEKIPEPEIEPEPEE